jgi:hypothetical protein
MKRVQHITVVGGGTAGWLAATYLQHNFFDIKITVIDKQIGKTIGFGEATVVSFYSFMESCGLKFHEWFPQCDATFKTGIAFPNWGNPETGYVFHPFNVNKSINQNFCSVYDLWAYGNQSLDFKESALPTYRGTIANTIEKNIGGLGFHIDCGKLVTYLQKVCSEKVEIIKNDVIGVMKDDHGDIINLVLKDGELHHSDLFVDCTGFASILKDQKKVDLYGQGRLFTNSAVAGQIGYENIDKEQVPYTRCPAVDHGWIWKVPTQNRIGSGLVFNRNITDIDVAKQYFSDHWNGRIKPEELRYVEWDPHYIKNFWEGNVVSIGLSGGFIEPLESTGIEGINLGILTLASFLPERSYTKRDTELYNVLIKNWYEDCCDFVNAHYSNSQWETPFWNYVKETHVKSDKQRHYEQWMKDVKRNFFSQHRDDEIFTWSNWHAILIQLGYPVYKDLGYMGKDKVNIILDSFIENENKKILESNIDHQKAIKMTNSGILSFT